jgi:hypothetical protein
MAKGAYNGKLLAEDALRKQARRLGAAAADKHWSGVSFLNSSWRLKAGVGVLTFGPSAVMDAMQSIDRDVDGRLEFDGKKFAIASARSQSGNLLAFGTAEILTWGLVVTGTTVAAPAILIGLAVGFGVALYWNGSGAADATGRYVAQKLGQ